MRSSTLVVALRLVALAVLVTAGAPPGTVQAQTATTGAIQGVVTDRKTGAPLGGVTIVIDGGELSTVSDDDGTYRITGLTPGEHVVTFFFGEAMVSRPGVGVGARRTTSVHQKIDVTGEVIDLQGDRLIDPVSTTLGDRYDRRYWTKVPVPGNTFLSVVTAGAGVTNDGNGPAMSGSTSAENRYFLDGVDTTGLRYGQVGSPVINEFIEEIEVISGGYNAEYGRATGGVVNVVTRTGTNRLEGSVFAYVRPGALTAARERTPTEASSIDARTDLTVDANVGAVVSGPIVRDRLWFVVGAAPTYTQQAITRTTRRRTDCRQLMDDGKLSECRPEYADTQPDVDPATGFRIFEDLSSRVLRPTAIGANLLGKLNYLLTPEQQGQLSVSAMPSRTRSYGVYGLPSTTDFDGHGLTTDVSARWTSKLNDGKTDVELVLGWHRDQVVARNRDAAARDLPLEILRYGNLGTWSQLPGSSETAETRAGCLDGGAGDAYPLIANCPDEGVGYRVGGGGSFVDDVEDRATARLSLTQRFRAHGTHEVKAGVDVEDDRLRQPRAYTGGVFYDNDLRADLVDANLWVQVGPPGTTDARFDRTCAYTPEGANMASALPCRRIGQRGEGATIEGETLNWSAYLRDSWQLRPNLTLNAGVRYEEQRLRFADYLQDEVDPLTGRAYGKNAMTMTGMWAPRVGLLYDWTREGRSKLYGHWGRFYEAIPMDINARSFAGEVNYRMSFSTAPDPSGRLPCGAAPPGYGGASGTGCDLDAPDATDLVGVNGSVVAPGLKPQYLDELIIGAEYEIMDDTKLAVSYQRRGLGRVIEDVSTDGASTYVIANPGEWDEDAEADLVRQRAAATDPVEQARLDRLLAQFRGIRVFDKPVRDYHALQIAVTRRFSKALFLQGSYTFSRTIGNFPGLISYDNGQIDPNISSQYDLVELLANRYGPLPQDRPHYLKLDGYYQIDLRRAGMLTLGTRMRALSGVPRDVLGRHPRYGLGESFLLPRGEIGRTRFETGLDLRIGYARRLAHGMELEVYADVFNVLDDQGVFGVDENYTYQSAVNPIVGGTYEDLVFAKENVVAGADRGAETRNPIRRSPNFGKVSQRYAPRSAQLGARLSF